MALNLRYKTLVLNMNQLKSKTKHLHLYLSNKANQSENNKKIFAKSKATSLFME